MSDGAGSPFPIHPLVDAAQKLGDPLPSLVELKGYLGTSSTGGYVRLYVDLDFLNYIEFPFTGFIAADPVDPVGPYLPTRVYVRADVTLTRYTRPSTSTAAEFAVGSIVEDSEGSEIEVDAMARVILRKSTPPKSCVPPPSSMLENSR